MLFAGVILEIDVWTAIASAAIFAVILLGGELIIAWAFSRGMGQRIDAVVAEFSKAREDHKELMTQLVGHVLSGRVRHDSGRKEDRDEE